MTLGNFCQQKLAREPEYYPRRRNYGDNGGQNYRRSVPYFARAYSLDHKSAYIEKRMAQHRECKRAREQHKRGVHKSVERAVTYLHRYRTKVCPAEQVDQVNKTEHSPRNEHGFQFRELLPVEKHEQERKNKPAEINFFKKADRRAKENEFTDFADARRYRRFARDKRDYREIVYGDNQRHGNYIESRNSRPLYLKTVPELQRYYKSDADRPENNAHDSEREHFAYMRRQPLGRKKYARRRKQQKNERKIQRALESVLV